MSADVTWPSNHKLTHSNRFLSQHQNKSAESTPLCCATDNYEISCTRNYVKSTEIFFIRESVINEVHSRYPESNVTNENYRSVFSLIIMERTTTKVLLPHCCFHCHCMKQACISAVTKLKKRSSCLVRSILKSAKMRNCGKI